MRVTVSGIENSIFWDLRRTIDQIALSAAAHDSCEHQVPVIGQRGDELSGRPDHHQRLVAGQDGRSAQAGCGARGAWTNSPAPGPYRT